MQEISWMNFQACCKGRETIEDGFRGNDQITLHEGSIPEVSHMHQEIPRMATLKQNLYRNMKNRFIFKSWAYCRRIDGSCLCGTAQKFLLAWHLIASDPFEL
ncbi:hypothetical protein EBAPG3_007955 [Nitrosospira lacus]|uniref:Uncharacterized protein n=1 Tax=Nitrosospira lacus TaxID=1288494 RepID=A0A1W6SPK0_9PROT|nr:hypothetical protein EBAPG3_007955 [Nitrosospira lacus]